MAQSVGAEVTSTIGKVQIKKVAVIGAGVMEAAIAAHMANVGIPCLLLDIVPQELTDEEKAKGLSINDKVVRNRLSEGGKKRLLKEKPSPIFSKQVLDLIHVGNLEDDFQKLTEMDWIIEVVVENLRVKQELLRRIEQVWKPGMVVSSNTSGVSIHQMVEGCSDEFKSHFLGTHFFNPPRYMKLLEVIPTSFTHPALLQEMKWFGEEVLGKGVVVCKDTPNFIANRIGTYGLQITLKAMEEMELDPSEVDDVTGRAMGRPKSATFRTPDLVGLDTFVHVANNVYENVDHPIDKEAFRPSPLLEKMVANKWLGEKSGQGFYKKVKTGKGKEILVLNPKTLEYQERKKLKARSLEQSKKAKTTSQKFQALVYAEDKAGQLAWYLTKKVLLYAAERVEEIAGDIVSIDQAMRWGFNWDLGPFQVWDAIGVEKSTERMREEGEKIPKIVEDLLAAGETSFYKAKSGKECFFHTGGGFSELNESEKHISLACLKEQGKVIKANKGASLIDIGDGIVCLEFHSPKQAIGVDIISMINFAVKEVDANYCGLVIGNQAGNFCVGANLMLMLMEAQDQNWPELNLIVQQFQKAMGSLRYLNRPVIAAPFGMTLGGGAEVCFPCDRLQASAETYMGLVEVGVGLIPGGGGNKEMLIRWTEGVSASDRVLLQPLVNHVFTTIGQAKVSTSGLEARKYKFLRSYDGVSMNKDFLTHDAKQVALGMARAGYRAPAPVKIPVVGETGYNVLKLGMYSMLKSGYISEHDYTIGKKLAYVLSGGSVAEGTVVSEQYLLDLEREAFLSLIGEPKSQQRMQHMLTKGKPLRN